MRRLILTAALGVTAGCDDSSYREMGAQVGVLAQRNDFLVARAYEELRGFGERPLPLIETALHTASLPGKLNLVRALDKMDSGAAIPILRHFAVYDAHPEVRSACEALLARWAHGTDQRAQEAQVAVQRIAEKRALGEGPGPQ